MAGMLGHAQAGGGLECAERGRELTGLFGAAQCICGAVAGQDQPEDQGHGVRRARPARDQRYGAWVDGYIAAYAGGFAAVGAVADADTCHAFV